MVEDKNVSLVVLGMIGVIAVLGLVLMFSGGEKTAGALATNQMIDGGYCDSPCTLFPGGNVHDNELQETRAKLKDYYNAGQTKFTYADGTEVVLDCLCPPPSPKGTERPQFNPIPSEQASLIGERQAPVPVNPADTAGYPGFKEGPSGQKEPYPPVGTNTF